MNIHDAKLMSRALQVNGWERATLGWAGGVLSRPFPYIVFSGNVGTENGLAFLVAAFSQSR
ncbi:MAG: hypothetical protein IZT59_07335 [Verrucomicrobia bacterium]|nr:hypothetical protein [Verrucomicrobiota bacterium]